MKDPRFNFYVDNYVGGTRRMNFLQKGAYVDLLILNFYCLSDNLPGFTAQEAATTLAPAGEHATALWETLKGKFILDGEHFCNERLKKEFSKSKTSSQKQTERANKRWGNDETGSAVAPARNGIENGNEIKINPELEKRKIIFIADVRAANSNREYKLTDTQLQKFCDYWTEHNIRGLKMRWEKQTVFDINRRITTWQTNDEKFRTGKNKGYTSKSNTEIIPKGKEYDEEL